jgi:hypothetical protein
MAAVPATTIGFALGFDHIGWFVGAVLFVMRPGKDIQKLWSIGRAIQCLWAF